MRGTNGRHEGVGRIERVPNAHGHRFDGTELYKRADGHADIRMHHPASNRKYRFHDDDPGGRHKPAYRLVGPRGEA